MLSSKHIKPFFYFEKLPPYTTAGYDLTTHSSSLLEHIKSFYKTKKCQIE
jgi:hypothetical protein